MEKIPIIITVQGGIVQNVDSPEKLDVLVLGFDKGSDDYLCCIRHPQDPKNWKTTAENARKSIINKGYNPNEYSNFIECPKQEQVSVTINWGQTAHYTETYNFNTQEELDAFLHGCNESEGWLGHEIIENTEKET